MTRKPTPPLTEDQQAAVLLHLPLAYSIAHSVWRQAALPVSDLEELRAEAVLEMVACASRNGVKDGRILCSIQVGRKLWDLVEFLKRHVPATEPWTIPAPAEGESNGLLDSVLALLPALPDRQREILERRYGLNGEGAVSWSVAAEAAGTTPSHARRAEQRAVKNIRNLIRGGLGTGPVDLEALKRSMSRGGNPKKKGRRQ